MNRCSNPDHPHCTLWVMPGDGACAHGHAQPAPAAAAARQIGTVDSEARDIAAAAAVVQAAAILPSGPVRCAASPVRPHLHVSGFDPRAAGGRQLLKLELRGMPADCAREVTLLASSRLRLDGGARHAFTRTLRGEWLPVFLEFSSRDLEHGQYRIALELRSRPALGLPARTWVATLLILAPRLDASLHEIHQTFLATHKNVRVSADDGSIARVRGQLDGGGRLDIDVSAYNAGIAHLDLDAGGGKIDLGFSSIAWDEDLLETDPPARAPAHACPASAACIAGPATQAGQARYLRLFALDECVLGRLEPDAMADVLLAHHDGQGIAHEGLTRRISARHALIRRGRAGYEIEDVSRYGLLVDGAWPGKHMALPLRPGMRLAFTASIPGVVVLEVAAVLPNGIVLQRTDAGAAHEAIWLLDPERHPGSHPGQGAPGLPLLFHRDGGFWHLDPGTGVETALSPTAATSGLSGWPADGRFRTDPYPELRLSLPSPAAHDHGFALSL
ncbi:FHA domain-containing protein [Massilia sp. Se16.2.3]|nr:FHA domain-containing protein [Massilia sp. Se16.2.3]